MVNKIKTVCRVHKPNAERITKAKNGMPQDDIIKALADFFDALGNSTRLKILFSLMNGELCTCDLTNITNLSVSAISHQLRILKDRRIVTYRKDGKNVFYRLEDKHIVDILKASLQHMEE